MKSKGYKELEVYKTAHRLDLDEYNELGRKLNKFITAVESRT